MHRCQYRETAVDKLRKLRRMLHGRQRLILRREISVHTARLEALRAAGKIGKVIRSVLQEDGDLYTLETLPITGEDTLTDHRLIHKIVTVHFQQWYQGPTSPAPPWATLLSDNSLYRDYARSKLVPDELAELLWRALTDVPNIQPVRDDLAVELAMPAFALSLIFNFLFFDILSFSECGARNKT